MPQGMQGDGGNIALLSYRSGPRDRAQSVSNLEGDQARRAVREPRCRERLLADRGRRTASRISCHDAAHCRGHIRKWPQCAQGNGETRETAVLRAQLEAERARAAVLEGVVDDLRRRLDTADTDRRQALDRLAAAQE